MAVTYKLMHLGTRVGEWPTLEETADGVRAHLAQHGDEIESLRLVGFLSSYESGSQPAFTIAGPDIASYLTAATTALTPRTEADDAAKAVARLPEEQRRAILDLLQPSRRRRIQALLEHAHPTAGQLMSQRFFCLYSNQTVQDAKDRVRTALLPDEVAAKVFVVDRNQHLEGAVSLAQLLRLNPDTPLGEVAEFSPAVRTDAQVAALATLMAEHDTTVIPVLDDRERPAGVITVDDVLEILLPTRWGQ
jgi:Mg/Co/Ni transporter MgtE